MERRVTVALLPSVSIVSGAVAVSRSLRIAFLVSRFPGPTHLPLWQEAAALERLGHEVVPLSSRPPRQRRPLADWAQEAAARTHYLSPGSRPDAARALGSLMRRGLPLWTLAAGPRFAADLAAALGPARALVTLAEQRGIDHVHAVEENRGGLIAALARRLGGPGYSLTLARSLGETGRGQAFRWRGAAFGRIVSHRLHASLEESLPGAMPPRIAIQPMGVDTALLRRSAAYEAPQRGRPVRLFSCGALAPLQGHQDLLAAMRQLLDQGVDVRLDIGGAEPSQGGAYRAVLEAEIKRLRLQDHARLIGALTPEALRDYLEVADLFVAAPWWDAQGLSLMEAMAMGVPVIGTEAGGIPEVVEDGRTGLLVPPRQPAMLARTIRDLVGDADRMAAYGAAGHAHVATRFTPEIAAATIADEIERAIDAALPHAV